MNRYTVLAAAGVAAAGYYLLLRRNTRQTDSSEYVASPPPITIQVFYGSQTGTSESFARDLVEEARTEHGFPDSVIQEARSVESVTDWAEQLAPNAILVFVLSTYGEGDPSDDAMSFNEFFSEKEIELKNVRFAIFGCGNRQYALFNEMAKRTEKNLTRFGGEKICLTGLGDDNADIEQDFRDWKDRDLWSQLKDLVVKAGVKLEKSGPRNPKERILLDIQIAEKRSKLKFDACVSSSGGDVLSKFFFAANQALVTETQALCDSKTLVELDISKVPCLRYRSGDTLELLPRNRESAVNWLLSLYEIAPSEMLTFVKNKSCKLLSVKKPFPTPVNVKFAIESYIDLHGLPSRSLIRDLCLVLCREPESIIARRDEVLHGNGIFTVETLLRELHVGPKTIELGDLIQLLPKQKSRGYSIASSPLEDSKKMKIVISRVDDHALASTFLSDILKKNELVNVGLRQGTFRLPSLPGTPVIMIAAGTGVAPFRAFIVELGLKNRSQSAHLFFGCRRESEWIFREEMEAFQQQGGYLQIAFSREGNKCYVQDLIKQNNQQLKELIVKKRAIVYVCGSTKMGLDVMEAVDKTIANVADLRKQKRYFEELWG